jgi:Mn2+/Fe2+ NRAMP family transporter
MPPPRPASGQPHRAPWVSKLLRLGPGIVTGAADVDPALVLTATVVGAAYRFSLLWVVILCVPFLVTVFAVSARLGYQTRQGLVDLLRANYGRGVALACAALVVVINMAQIIADLMAVSDALSIITTQHRAFFVGVTAFSIWYILIFRDYRKITKALLWLSLPLFIYVAAAVYSAPSPHSLMLKTFMPRMGKDPAYIEAVVGLFGSLLTPYVLVWQTSSRREHAVIGEEHPTNAESHMGTFVVSILSFSVMVAAASVLHLSHPVDMTTREAAEALQPVVGRLGQDLFALGIIGAGLVALPVLVASMCYSVSEAMAWKSGLSEHPWEAKGFYVLISASMFIATAVNFFRINPVTALYWSMILAGALTPPILIFILVLSNDRRVIRVTNTKGQNFWIGACAGGLIAVELAWLWWSIV